MLSTLQKWGNSQGIRLSKDVLSELQLQVGDQVEISVHQGQIIIEPVSKARGTYSLKDLVAQLSEDDEPQELNWGQPQGQEVW